METGTIKVKIDLNDYLIPATKSKRFKDFYYIRKEEEYTGDLNTPRKLMYTLEKCRGKRGEQLVSHWYKRTELYKCWIVNPELKLQDFWEKSGNLDESFVHLETIDEVKKVMEETLKYG